MVNFEKKSLEDILLTGNKDEEERYYQILEEINTSRISKQILESHGGKSIDYICRRIWEEEESNRSSVMFPGDLVILYPNIKEQRAKEYITCDFSSGIIYPGSWYVSYRPLLDNISTNERYVLKKTIKVETGYSYDLPSTIIELEALEQRMKLTLDQDETGIQYSHLNQRMGGELVLQKLKRRK